jgi:prepilin-type N-terminal cleavage/methylation domain-containing protein
MTTSATGNERPARAAFTLIELSIAIFIIALMMAITVPAFVRSYNTAVLNETVRSFATSCQYARIEAVTRQHNVTLHIDIDRQMFWISQPASTDEPVSAERTDQPARQERQVQVDFYPNGTCDPVTVVFRGSEAKSGLAATVDPITARTVNYPVRL